MPFWRFMPVCEPDPVAERSISMECSVGCTSTAGWQKAELAEVLRGYRSDHFRWLLKQLNEIESRLRKQTHPYGDLVASRRGGKRAAMAVAHRVLVIAYYILGTGVCTTNWVGITTIARTRNEPRDS